MVKFTLVALEYDSTGRDGPVFEGDILYKEIEWPVLPAIDSEWVVEPIDEQTGKIDNHSHNPFTNTIDVEMRVEKYIFKDLKDDPSWLKKKPSRP